MEFLKFSVALGEALAPYATIVGMLAALIQYRRNSKRERARRAADEMETLTRDPAVRNALSMIDWGAVEISVAMADETSQRIFVDRDLLRAALRHHAVGKASVEANERMPEERFEDAPLPEKLSPAGFSRDEHLIRNQFDALLDRLERIDNLIANDVISQKDFGDYFSYWLDLMGEEVPAGVTPTHFSRRTRRLLWSYIDLYQFKGVRRLFARYGRASATARYSLTETTPPAPAL